MNFHLQTEMEGNAFLLRYHLGEFVERLRKIPPDKWEWSPAPPAPTARQLAEHAWSWLQTDRQHLREPDVSLHTHIPTPPDAQQAMCDALEAEAQEWHKLLTSLTDAQLLEPRKQFGFTPVNVRFFIYHILQNTIYKNGQLATLYFALGLDGSEPYKAPMPNDIYAEVDDILAFPLHGAIFKGDVPQLESLLQAGADVNATASEGVTPLMASVFLNNLEALRILLAHNADTEVEDRQGNTALKIAEMSGNQEAADLLRQ
ncbi:MAG TPA: ankyrin repeat domain-containing protein [Chthonomonadaceae bacterium]|nr:ankyrin repeat domain-containing protein [Chthonomonadaceae bacterium]